MSVVLEGIRYLDPYYDPVSWTLPFFKKFYKNKSICLCIIELSEFQCFIICTMLRVPENLWTYSNAPETERKDGKLR